MATPFQCTFFISKLLKSFKKAIKSCLWLPDKMWAFFGPNMTHNCLAPSVPDKACVRICPSSSCFFDQAIISHCMCAPVWGKYKKLNTSSKTKSTPCVPLCELGGSIQWVPRIGLFVLIWGCFSALIWAVGNCFYLPKIPTLHFYKRKIECLLFLTQNDKAEDFHDG